MPVLVPTVDFTLVWPDGASASRPVPQHGHRASSWPRAGSTPSTSCSAALTRPVAGASRRRRVRGALRLPLRRARPPSGATSTRSASPRRGNVDRTAAPRRGGDPPASASTPPRRRAADHARRRDRRRRPGRALAEPLPERAASSTWSSSVTACSTTWRDERWDAFCASSRAQLAMRRSPATRTAGDDPDGFRGQGRDPRVRRGLRARQADHRGACTVTAVRPGFEIETEPSARSPLTRSCSRSAATTCRRSRTTSRSPACTRAATATPTQRSRTARALVVGTESGAQIAEDTAPERAARCTSIGRHPVRPARRPLLPRPVDPSRLELHRHGRTTTARSPRAPRRA